MSIVFQHVDPRLYYSLKITISEINYLTFRCFDFCKTKGSNCYNDHGYIQPIGLNLERENSNDTKEKKIV